MAYDKPWRYIQARPRAVGLDGHQNCMHSLFDKQKITHIPSYYAYHVLWDSDSISQKFLRNMAKLKRLVKRRRAMKNVRTT